MLRLHSLPTSRYGSGREIARQMVRKKSQGWREISKTMPARVLLGAVPDEDAEQLLRAAMREMRRRLRKGAGTSYTTSNTLKARDRFARRKARELLKAVKKPT